MIQNPQSSGTAPVFAGAVVSGPDGRILCQLRDDKPGIIYPGFWSSTPGGHVEPGESPREAIVRELKEEFAIEVADVQPLAVLVENDEALRGTYHAFTVALVTPMNQVRCLEGQKACFFHPEEALKLRMHPTSRKILNRFLERKNGAQTST